METVATGEEREAEAENTTETTTTELLNWQNVVAPVQAEFGEGQLAEEAICQAVVLTPKG